MPKWRTRRGDLRMLLTFRLLDWGTIDLMHDMGTEDRYADFAMEARPLRAMLYISRIGDQIEAAILGLRTDMSEKL